MLYAHLSEKEKSRFCSLLMAAVSEDLSITGGEQDALIRERIELDISDISDHIPYEEAVTWLCMNCSDLTKRSMLLEIAILLYNDSIITGEESELLYDLARRFKVEDLRDFIHAAKKISAGYDAAAGLFDAYL